MRFLCADIWVLDLSLVRTVSSNSFDVALQKAVSLTPGLLLCHRPHAAQLGAPAVERGEPYKPIGGIIFFPLEPEELAAD